MRLCPPDTETLPLVANWLGREDIHRWLDFGLGVQRVTRISLKMMTQRDIHCLRVYTPEGEDRPPIGVVGLSNINRKFGSATVWALLGERRFGGRGHTYRATARIITHAFDELGLATVNAWAVDTNVASQRILRRLGFREIGRQRQCHRMDGRLHDRVLFDILASEHRDIDHDDDR
jgi:RimJ/RimL family protein N-acetyltransferase